MNAKSYSYKAFDKRAGREVKDTIEAGSEAEAIAQLKSSGMVPMEVKAARAGRSKGRTPSASGESGGKGGGLFGGRVKPVQVTDFTRQLSTLQDAGLPIVQSLQILTDMQRPGPFRNALAQATEEVQSGTMLSEGLGSASEDF